MMGPLRWVNHPSFSALLIRRTFGELEKTLIPRSQVVYRATAPGAKYDGQNHVWIFPSGARIYFGYLERDEQVMQYQGAEFSFLGWDELTHFSEYQYRYMLSRVRGTAGLPKRIRAGTNPGGPGHEWVQKRWAPWLQGPGSDGGPSASPGQKLHYLNPVGCSCFERGSGDDVERYVPEDFRPRCEHEAVFSRVFIPAKVADNPKLDRDYAAQLGALDALTRAQLLDGNWLIRAAPGLLFRRQWFKFCDHPPANYRWVRWWDRAATNSDPKKHNDPDWTVGLKLGIGPDKSICVGDVVRMRATPQEVKQAIRATAEMDGVAVKVTGGKDPGAAGVFEADEYTRFLQGFNVVFYPETGDKIVRAGPASAQCEAGNVTLVRGLWNEPFLRCLENFPTKGQHDDDVDALSGAFEVLVGHPAPSYEGIPKVVTRWRTAGVGR